MYVITAPSELLILIISQENSYHKQLNENLRSNIYKQSISLSTDHVIHVHVLHEIFNHPGDWTFLAVLPKLTTSNLIKSNTKWIVLCEDRSLIQLKPLIDNLSQEDYTKVRAHFSHEKKNCNMSLKKFTYKTVPFVIFI